MTDRLFLDACHDHGMKIVGWSGVFLCLDLGLFHEMVKKQSQFLLDGPACPSGSCWGDLRKDAKGYAAVFFGGVVAT